MQKLCSKIYVDQLVGVCDQISLEYWFTSACLYENNNNYQDHSRILYAYINYFGIKTKSEICISISNWSHPEALKLLKGYSHQKLSFILVVYFENRTIHLTLNKVYDRHDWLKENSRSNRVHSVVCMQN